MIVTETFKQSGRDLQIFGRVCWESCIVSAKEQPDYVRQLADAGVVT